MKPATQPSALHVQRILGPAFTVLEFDDSTRKSAEAAAAIGCTVAQIAKTLVFRGRTSGDAIMVIASGANRVDEKAVAALIGEAIERATPEFVRESTGFAIGGVSPVGHPKPLRTLLDDALFGFGELWAAAGTPNAVFRLTPDDLVRLTGGERVAVARA
jgi:prolyl-tRNA editing enzyme YbaK/EbsC (Cys-tRNA(Pro) deacylase)